MENTKQIYNRWNAAADLSLLEEIQHYSPYAAEDEEKAWNGVVESINTAKLLKKPTDVRALKDRMEILVAAFKATDLRKKSRSGTEEQYGRMEELLQDVLSAMESANEARRQKTKAATDLKAQQDRLKKRMRGAGEDGRRVPGDHDESVADNEGLDKWLEENPGCDKGDWLRDPQAQRKAAGSDDAGESSSSSGSGCVRSSRGQREKAADVDVLRMDFMAKQDEKKLKFKEQKAADDKEIRLMELENERLRLEVEKLKWTALAKRNNAEDAFLYN